MCSDFSLCRRNDATIPFRIAADAQCTVIATASEDKTARVYRGDGSALSVLRPPIGPGNGGKLRAVTVSPDGRLVVVGGWDVAVARTASDFSAQCNDRQRLIRLRCQ